MQLEINKYDVLIHDQVLKILENFTQYKRNAPEAGGIMIGKVIDSQINIIKLSVPTQLDRSSRTNFERSKLSAQIIIDYEFFNSGGQLIYLGEWHTHPESSPVPSNTDLKMLQNQFKNNILNTDFLILLIKGTNHIYIRIIDKDGFYEKTIKTIF
ncbi:Mov34/MPN/PAD-1 family protein [uncultured Flavobacterium sp.]|uniref:Mov34/MPN/PAD-1 family protein n=1 Tax=uncultured Flavobacterium sp. TaxID=165435 RepID=UPI002594534B|nr:Mov34/MPN/PAD-1 family protein [uncultured Flavobacterium sp.]